jgi:hypothetical protein
VDEKRELILGFDIRVEDHLGSRNWSAERRNEFLLRTDVLQPYSVDTIVWPSVLDNALRPNTCIGHQDLWGDLSCLRSVSSSEAPEGSTGKLVVVGLITEESTVERNWWQLNAPPSNPSQPGKSWQLLGYDVADRWLLSGLSNCSFLSAVDGLAELRGRWNSKLNDHHLLRTTDEAKAFQTICNHRVPEHSPFFVYSIRIVQE